MNVTAQLEATMKDEVGGKQELEEEENKETAEEGENENMLRDMREASKILQEKLDASISEVASLKKNNEKETKEMESLQTNVTMEKETLVRDMENATIQAQDSNLRVEALQEELDQMRAAQQNATVSDVTGGATGGDVTTNGGEDPEMAALRKEQESIEQEEDEDVEEEAAAEDKMYKEDAGILPEDAAASSGGEGETMPSGKDDAGSGAAGGEWRR